MRLSNNSEGAALIYLTSAMATGSGQESPPTDGALINRRHTDSRRQQIREWRSEDLCFLKSRFEVALRQAAKVSLH